MNDVNILKNNGVDLESSLEFLGDIETYDETLAEFLNGIADKLTQISNYKEQNDMNNYSILVHSLKSDARYLGFTKLSELALNHETESKAENTAYVNDHFNELLNEVRNAVKIGLTYLKNQPTVETTPTQEVQTPEKKDSILVVDDSDMVLNFISRVFNDTFNVVLANSGKAAIDELSKDNNIKGVLLDLNMPGVNGFEVLDFLKENDLFVKYPVSIITGADDKDTITRAFTYQIIDMLQKPFNERDVKRIIERTINYGK